MQGLGQAGPPPKPSQEPGPSGAGLAPAASGATPAPDGQQANPAEGLSPEALTAINKLYGFSMVLLYEDKFSKAAEKTLKNSPTPEAGAAEVAATIAIRIYMEARKSGSSIPPEAMLIGGVAIMREVAEFAERYVGAPPMTQEQIEDAFLVASDIFRDAVQGNHDFQIDRSPEALQDVMDRAGGPEALEALEQRKKRVTSANIGGQAAAPPTQPPVPPGEGG